ncbi:hypothetical protein [uncultured Gimesia sp.]|uniref:hypothetical protein n=1 Tax=uncultured Gimesia sp. TaxID=1678688 RepID=UPI00261CC520|nr:hypothetical protein [uncultured Gimesia sp.]
MTFADTKIDNEDLKSDPILRHFPTMLHRWKGGRARMYTLTDSHKSLTIRIEINGKKGNLHLSCSPTHICGPVEWTHAELEVKRDANGDFIIYDESVNLEIKSDGCVEIAENVNPIY